MDRRTYLGLILFSGHREAWGVIFRGGLYRSPTRPPYPAHFRAEAVRLVRQSGKAMSQIAKGQGVSTESFRQWVHQAGMDSGEREGLTAAEREELRQLGREVRILREERGILRKDAAFFAREAGRTL